MRRNFTKTFLCHFLIHKEKHDRVKPKKETIDKILAYAKSLDVVKTRSLGKILINSN